MRLFDVFSQDEDTLKENQTADMRAFFAGTDRDSTVQNPSKTTSTEIKTLLAKLLQFGERSLTPSELIKVREYKRSTSLHRRQFKFEEGVAEGHGSEELANEVYAEFERTYPNLARRADERTVHAAIMDVLNYGGDSNPSALAQDVARAVKQEMQQGVAEAAALVTHRIGLTVTDPNHPMVSKRGETYQKSVRVTGPDREAAINQAIAHYRRKGYKVHDHHYLGTVDEPMAEATGDKPFDQMMTTIKRGTNKQKTADRKEQQKQTQQQARNAFGNMFGGGNPADKLKIREQGVAEGSLNELSSDLLKRSAQVATDKRNQAMDPELHNALGGGYMNPLATHYNNVSQKMDNRAAQVRKKETIQKIASKIASPAVMRKMGMSDMEEGVAEDSLNEDPVIQFASKAHNEWRKNFDPTGTKERIKKNSDGTEGNINVPFEELHPDWKKENLAAGQAAMMAVKRFPNNIEQAAEYIHNEWMKRNPKADYNAAQHVAYDQLPEDEKEKDRVHVRTMMALSGKQGVAEGPQELPQWKKDWYAQQKPNSWPKHPQPYHNPNWIPSPEELKKLKGEKGVAEGSLNEFAQGNGGDDGEAFNPGLAKMAQEHGFTKGFELADGASLATAFKITEWDQQFGGLYKQHFVQGFKKGRMDKINHNNKQHNLNLKLMKDGSIIRGEQGVAEGSLNEFAQGNGGGDSGNYFRELASAWYTGAYNSGSLQKGIKTNKDIERLLQRGIVAPDGVTRKYNIDYNSDFDGVIIFSDDYYEHGDDDETDSRTGKPFGLYDYMEFSDDELSESLGQGVAEDKWDPYTGGNFGQTPRPQRVGQDSQDSNTAEPDEGKDQAEWEAMLDYYGTNALVQRALGDLYKQTHGGGYHDSVTTPERYLATIEKTLGGRTTTEKKYFTNKQAAHKYAKGRLGHVVSFEKIDNKEDTSDLITLPVMLGLGQQKKKWMLQFPDEGYAQKWEFKHKNVAKILWEVGHNLEKEVAEGMERAVDAKGRTQSQWMKLVKSKYPDAKMQQAKMIDGPCQATLSDGRKLSWTKVQQGVAEASNTMQRYGQTIIKRARAARAAEQAARAAEPEPKKEEPPASSDYSSMSTRDYRTMMQQLKKPKKKGVAEARTSVAVRLGRAIERTQGKTAASQARSIIPSSIPKKEEPKKDEKKVDEGIQAGDGFIIECGDSAIETVVLGHYNDGILIEFDHTATFMLTDAGITLTEAEYQGRTVPLGKRMAGDVKKSKVYVKKPNGNVVKVNFGDKNMTIKKHLPKHRKSYRARHHCENPGPKWKANYWSCRAW